jgi:hypothetical protein
MTRRLWPGIIALVIGTVAIAGVAKAQQPSSAPASPTIPALNDVKPELLRLVIDDQWDRGNDMFSGRQVKSPDTLDWNAIAKRDGERESAVRSLLAEGQIETGKEFRFAALIFQHSDTDAGIALAHVLAVTAIINGDAGAKWLAAATLDRYLQRQKQPQLFGTQFTQQDGQWTMAPYDRATVPDSVRRLWCVVPQAEQDQGLKGLREGTGGANTSIGDCK